jgi:hypothetical protein
MDPVGIAILGGGAYAIYSVWKGGSGDTTEPDAGNERQATSNSQPGATRPSRYEPREQSGQNLDLDVNSIDEIREDR